MFLTMKNTALVMLLGLTAFSAQYSAQAQSAHGPIANGKYTLAPQNATDSRLDATNGSKISGTQIQIWKAFPGNTNQQWIFTYEGNGYYKIQPTYDASLAVGVAGNSSTNGTAVQLLTDDGSAGERWALTATGGGYTLTPACAAGTTMNVSGPSSADGTKIQIWQATGASNTIFNLGTK